MLRVAILAAVMAAVVVCTGGAVAAGGPMADAGLDQTVTVGTTVQLDGTGSGHPDGEITAYEWTIRTPDGRETEPDCTDCERSQFTPSTVGRYVVNLTVTGPDGAQSTDTLYVYVEDGGPEVELSGDRTPDPNQAMTYTASARSPDAELEEIAWAVEDEIVTVQSLDGSTDESQLSLAFSESETYRVQVVVRDSNGRTAYDQLYVQPQSGSGGVSSWSEVEPTGCDNSTYAARNAVECWDLDESSRPIKESEPTETPTLEPEEILYRTDGYEAILNGRDRSTDSSFVNSQLKEVGFDDGENAPWNGNSGVIDETVDEISRFLFGQERETETCNMTVGDYSSSGCQERVMELETQGETSNVYSKSKTGSYSEYGLTNAERIAGEDPTEFERGQNVKVTIVIQQEEDGVIEQTVEAIEPATDRVGDTAEEIVGGDSNGPSGSRTSSDSISTSGGSRELSDGAFTSNRGGLLSGPPNRSPSSSNETDSVSDEGISEPEDPRTDRGLIA